MGLVADAAVGAGSMVMSTIRLFFHPGTREVRSDRVREAYGPKPDQGRCKAGAEPEATGFPPALLPLSTGFASKHGQKERAPRGLRGIWAGDRSSTRPISQMRTSFSGQTTPNPMFCHCVRSRLHFPKRSFFTPSVWPTPVKEGSAVLKFNRREARAGARQPPPCSCRRKLRKPHAPVHRPAELARR